MRTPTYIAVKKVLQNEDSSTKQLKLKPLAKALGAENDDDVAFVELYMNSLVRDSRFSLTDKGEFYIPAGNKCLFIINENEVEQDGEIEVVFSVEEKVFEKEAIDEARDNGWQSTIALAAREIKRQHKIEYDAVCEILADLVNEKKN